jgi:tRNA uridine 5-carboxymethylaminomethyl modification enzyme
MTDDLTVQGVSEPYRMLTARSEYRLHLRADNAVSRLGPVALELGLLDSDQADRVRKHLEVKADAAAILNRKVSGTELGLADQARKPLGEWARREELMAAIRACLPAGAAAAEALDDAVYAPYLARLEGELAARTKDRAIAIPTAFNFSQVPGLSNEMRERLEGAGPADLDQAARIAGITPAALSALHFALVRASA